MGYSAGKVQIVGFGGPLWMMGWLFTLGYAHLGFFQGVVALLVWPYFLGKALS